MPKGAITPTSKKINWIIDAIEEGEIKIPPFQRGFVWDGERVKSFLDSIYNNYPIGSILLWNSKDTLRSIRNIGGFLLPENEPELPVNYVLDGQQRLTTLYGVFCKDRRPDPENNKIDLRLFDIYFDLNDEEFRHKEELKEGHSNLRMSALFDTSKFLKEIKTLKSAYRTAAEDVLWTAPL